MYSSATTITTKLSYNCRNFNVGLVKSAACFKKSVRHFCIKPRPNAPNSGSAIVTVASRLGYESTFSSPHRYLPLNFCFQNEHVRGVKSYGDERLCRNLSTTAPVPKAKKEKVTVTFIKKDGTRIAAEGKEGDSLYDIVINNSLDIDGYGACEGTASCSTCHLILKKEDYDQVQDKPSDEEQDLLDLAYDLTDTSRLGCMVHMTKVLDGLEVYVPEGINDVRVI